MRAKLENLHKVWQGDRQFQRWMEYHYKAWHTHERQYIFFKQKDVKSILYIHKQSIIRMSELWSNFRSCLPMVPKSQQHLKDIELSYPR
jgi:hypothetical protein